MHASPWLHVDHGTELLTSEDQLCAYIAAYGDMHMLKCRGIFQSIDFDKLGNCEIWDWGCGQALASLTFSDMLKERGKSFLLRKITLVEPSGPALQRAEINMRKACPNARIIAVNKYLPGANDSPDNISNTDYSYPNIIHLFSNILDIETIDLVKLANIISTPGHTHYLMCVGPMNRGAYRIERFKSIFKNTTDLATIDDYSFGYNNRNKNITCKARCFTHDGNSLNTGFDVSITPALQDGTLLRNDYDSEGWFKQLGLCERAIPFYNRLERSPQLNEHDSLLLAPEFSGEKCDIILVRPGKGILLLNILEGKPSLEKITEAIERLHALQRNLMRQHLSNMWGKIASHKSGVWNMIRMAILFPDCDCRTTYSWVNNLPYPLTLAKQVTHINGHDVPCGLKYVRFVGNDALTSDKWAMRLNDFAPIYDNDNFDDTTYTSLIKLVSPSWHSYKEGKGIELDTVQQRLADVPNRTVQINGVAGSGKTQILVQRAVNTHLLTGRPILILAYNITLANYLLARLNQVKADFSRNQFIINHYHGFFKENALSLGLKPEQRRTNGQKYIDDDEYTYSYDLVEFFSRKESETKRFDNIFIDEIQDFKPEWIEIIRRYFLTPGGEMVVFGDAAQNLYNRPLDSKGQIKIQIGRNGWNNSLNKSHRFVSQSLSDLLAAFNHRFIDTDNLGVAHQTSVFEEYSCLSYHNIGTDATAEQISELCHSIILDENRPAKDIAILGGRNALLQEIEKCLSDNSDIDVIATFETSGEAETVRHGDSKYPERDICSIARGKRARFTVDNQCLKISSVHCFKGWESPCVIIIIEACERNSRLIYTGLTRARERVIVINCGNEEYHEFFRNYKA